MHRRFTDCLWHFSPARSCVRIPNPLAILALAAISLAPLAAHGQQSEPPKIVGVRVGSGRSLQGRAVDAGRSHAARRQRAARRRAVGDRARRRRRARPGFHAPERTLPVLPGQETHRAAVDPLRPRPGHVDGRISRGQRRGRQPDVRDGAAGRRRALPAGAGVSEPDRHGGRLGVGHRRGGQAAAASSRSIGPSRPKWTTSSACRRTGAATKASTP